MVAVLTQWCNVYGGEWDGGAKRVLGGLEEGTPSTQWFCPTVSKSRFFMECEHGHRGPDMYLCMKHYKQYQGKVSFCPRCNLTDDHKCKVIIHEKS